MNTSEQINEIAAALSKAQGEFLVPKKSHTATVVTNKGTYAYHYSTLDELLAATRPALVKHGLAVVQNVTTVSDGGATAVSTVLIHASGQRLEFDPVTLPSGGTPQSVGTAITYARRYSLGAALNVAAEEDDDAQSVVPTKTAPAVRVPEGYASWLIDMQAVADEGVERLREEWKAQPEPFRRHLTMHDGPTYEALKARSQAKAKLVTA